MKLDRQIDLETNELIIFLETIMEKKDSNQSTTTVTAELQI